MGKINPISIFNILLSWRSAAHAIKAKNVLQDSRAMFEHDQVDDEVTFFQIVASSTTLLLLHECRKRGDEK